MSKDNLYIELNKQVANWGVLYTKLHHHHWFVKGPQFFTLHEKFEQLYTEAAAHLDELAERLLAIGGRPAATMKQYLELASIEEAGEAATAEEMVEETVSDFKILVRELEDARKVSEETGDEATADMLLAIQQSLEKEIWMLSSFLGE